MSDQHTMVDERRYKKALAEIERLRHEITTRSPDEAQAEIERLRARNVDLLAALKRVRRAVSNDKLKSQIDEIARAAIAKAEEK